MNIFFFFGFSNILDNERWKQVDVPSEMQEIVDSFNEGIYIWALYI